MVPSLQQLSSEALMFTLKKEITNIENISGINGYLNHLEILDEIMNIRGNIHTTQLNWIIMNTSDKLFKQSIQNKLILKTLQLCEDVYNIRICVEEHIQKNVFF